MSQFGQGIAQALQMAALAERMNQNSVQNQRYDDAVKRQEAERVRRLATEDASRRVWLSMLQDSLGLGAQAGGGLPVSGPSPTPGAPSVMAADQPELLPAASQQRYLAQMQGGGAQPGMPMSMFGSVDLDALQSADLGTVQSVAEAALKERQSVQSAQSKLMLEDFQRQSEAAEKMKRRMTYVNEAKRLGIDDQTIQRNLVLLGMADDGVPAGLLGTFADQMFGDQGAADWSMGQGLGYPEAMRPAFDAGEFSPMEAWKHRPDAEDPMMQPDPAALTEQFGQEIGAAVEKFTALRGYGMSPTDAWDLASGGDDGRKLEAAAGVAKRQTAMALDDVKRIQAKMQALYGGYVEPNAPELAQLQAAEQAYQAAQQQEQEILNVWQESFRSGGPAAGGVAPGAPQTPAAPAPSDDLQMFTRQITERLFPGVPPESLTPAQLQQIADQLNALNGQGTQGVFR